MLVLNPSYRSCAHHRVLISATKAIGASSGKYFIRQQMALADVTGFIEERMNGQRVIKKSSITKKFQKKVRRTK